VLVFAGAWFGLLVPFLFRRNDRQMMATYDDDPVEVDGGPGETG
jgi:hypothetical protein